MSLNDPDYSPEPYAHAQRHLDASEDAMEDGNPSLASVEALIGIGWAVLSIAKSKSL